MGVWEYREHQMVSLVQVVFLNWMRLTELPDAETC